MTTNDNFSSFGLWGLAEGKEKAVTPVSAAGTSEGCRQPAPLVSTSGEPLSLLQEGLQSEKFRASIGNKDPPLWDSLTILILLHNSVHQEKS